MTTQKDIGIAIAIVAVVATAVYRLFFSNSGPRKVLSPEEFREFKLIEKLQVSHNSALYKFALPRPTDVLGLPIGQHISVAARIGEKDIVRSYTPTSSDEDKGYFQLLIKTYPTGNVSRFVGDMKIGDSIRVRGPKGNFNYHSKLAKELIMIAGGTGIAPMYQIIKAIARDPNDNTKVTLIYANITHHDILLKKELDEIAASSSNITVYYVLESPPAEWDGGVGRISAEILAAKVAKASPDNRVLLCGPPPMVSFLKGALLELGYPKARALSKIEDQVFVF